MISSYTNAKLLEFLNHCNTTSTLLVEDVGLDSGAAVNITVHRDGPDGICGTLDDNPFDDVDELDDIPYVGYSALVSLWSYVETWQSPESLDAQVVDFVNDCTTTFGVLRSQAVRVYWFQKAADFSTQVAARSRALATEAGSSGGGATPS